MFKIILSLYLIFPIFCYSQDLVNDYNTKSQEVSNKIPDSKSINPSTTSAVSPDSIDFWDKLNSGVLDNLCKQAKIQLNKDYSIANIAGIEGGIKRYFERYPDKKIALIDEVNIKIQSSFGTEIIQIPDMGSLNASISGSVEGKSIVVRPLENDNYCKDLKKLIDLREVKTVLPINEKRISEMKVGEIWKLPIVTMVSFNGGVGLNPIPYITVSVGGGVTKERTPSITLYRMDKNILRLRVRIARILVRSIGGGISTTYEIAPADLGLFEAENVLTKLVNKEIAKQINKYLALKFNYGVSRTSQRKVMLEFLINTNDKEQMSSLVEFLTGNLGIIKRFIELGIKFNEFKDDSNFEEGLSSLDSVQNQASSQLGVKPSYAGANHSSSNAMNTSINIPFIHNHSWSSNNTYDRYQSLDGKEVLHIHQAQRVSEGSSLNLPFLGTLIKYRDEQNVYLINKESSQKVDDPSLLYEYNAGFVRNSEDSARSMIDKANGILKYIGTDGEGTNNEYVIDSNSIFPPSMKDELDELNSQRNLKTYKRGMIAFKLLISKEGIKQIIFSTPERILKAYLNMMKEFDSFIVDKFGSLFKFEKDKVTYDWKKVRSAMDPFDENYSNTIGVLDQLARTATNLIKDIFSVRDEAEPKKQAEKFSKIASGKGRTDIGYDNFMKIIVQLVSKDNLAGQVYISTDKKVKGEEDVNSNYVIGPNNNLSQTINQIVEQRDRFSNPSTLKD